jgi:energy-coupling factor transport system ATP-binding protein
VLGPSGSGKSTLALALAGLLGDDVPGEISGSIEVGTGDRGLVFQDADRQLIMERVDDDVAFGLESRAWPLMAMRARVPVALAQVGLADRPRTLVTKLSGGQRQRLALAGALAPDPALLVLDEPTANLDPAAAGAFLSRLADLKRSGGTTIVIVEHRVDDVWALADRVLVLDRGGRVMASGIPDDVAAAHAERLVTAGVWLPRHFEPGGGIAAEAPPRAPADTPAAGMPVRVEAAGLTFSYPDGPPVVDDLDLAVSAGERLAIVGANGSGKSTLARLLVGLLEPDAGSVRIAGLSPGPSTEGGAAAGRPATVAGLVFQDPELGFLAQTVDEDVRLGLPPGSETEARVEVLMTSLGLPLAGFGPRSPYRLSGGEQRRLSLAPALLRRPSLLVLDEPTFGQDRAGVAALVERLRDLSAGGLTVIAISHDARFVAAFASRVLELRGRRLHDLAWTASSAAEHPIEHREAPLDDEAMRADHRALTPLGRASPLTKLAVAMTWLVAVVVAPTVVASVVLGIVALASAWLVGRVPLREIAARLVPLAGAAAGIALFTAIFAAANTDPAAVAVISVGPLAVSGAGLEAAVRVGARLLAIGAISLSFSATTPPTALADGLVQQARVSDRFAYGALAAYGALPRLRSDLRSLREARILRGLSGALHPRLLMALLVLAIRHADRLGVAMDARGFGRGPRSAFRPRSWGWADVAVLAGGIVMLVVAAVATLG